MNLLKALIAIPVGAVAGVVAVTALPILAPGLLFGAAAVGTISEAGIVIGTTIGAAAGVSSAMNDDDD